MAAPQDKKEVTIVVDGVSVKAIRGETVASAAQRAGIFVPSLSADLRLPRDRPSRVAFDVPDPVGIAEFPGGLLLPASSVLVETEGLVVKFKSPAARAKQQAALSTLLQSHFGDCYPPCQMACPCRVPGADFIKMTLEGRMDEALMQVIERNPFALVCGTVCPRFCEDACRRNVIDQPVNINDIKRFLYMYNRAHKGAKLTCAPSTGKQVAIVGAGPAGLACAHFLARKGHKCTVYEALPNAGGMLRYGIPAYRLPKEELDEEIKFICQDIGVDIQCNKRMGRDFTLADLQRDNDAVYVAIGSQMPTMLRFPGSDSKGVIGGVDFLRDVALGQRPSIGKRVLVIGGGNVSIDVARTCLRLGIKDVILTCVLRKEDMPAHPLEIKEALAEGVQLDILAQPMRITPQPDGKLAIEYRKRPNTADIFDFTVSIPGSEYTYTVDSIILAIGQRLDTKVCQDNGIPLNARGNAIAAANDKTYISTLPNGGAVGRCVGVFVGGDAVLTPMTVVHCVSSARKASRAMHQLLSGKKLEDLGDDFDDMKYFHSRGTLPQLLETQKAVTQGPKRVPYFAGVPLSARNPTVETMHPHEAAQTFKPISAPFTEAMARAEAARCLQCGCGNPHTCHLRKVAEDVGVESRAVVPMTPIHLHTDNPFFNRDLDKCVHCTRCIRACAETRNIGAIDDPFTMNWRSVDLSNRRGAVVDPFVCESCGTCLDVCPTNALFPKRKEVSGDVVVRTTCSYCGCGCGLLVHMRNGKPVAVKGDPVTQSNHGQLCVKGRFGLIDYNTCGERLTTPLIRKDGKLVPATWEEAMSLIAAKFLEIKQKYGPDALQAFASAKTVNEENYLMMKIFRSIIGTNNVDHCARLCHASTVAGLALAFGSGAMTNSSDELEFAKCILITGSNTSETHPIIALRVKAAAKRGCKIIIADPRRINLCSYACLHIRQRSGTDVYLYNAMMNVILQEKLHKPDFIANFTENFDAFAAEVAKYTPEQAELVTGVPADDIRKAARIYATSETSSIIFSMGITQHSTGVDNVLTLANLAMLTGQIGRPSTGVNPLRGQNNVQGACDMGALPNVFSGYQKIVDAAIRAKFEKAWGMTTPLPDKVGFTVTQAINQALAGKIKAIYIMGENPLMSDPNLHHAEEALDKLEFLVVQDIVMTETARHATVVLPAASLFEKTGTFTNTERRVLRVNQMMAPPGLARQDWEILVDFANRMGGHLSYPRGNLDILDEINAVTPSYGGITNERLVDGMLQWPCPNKDHPGTVFLHKDGKFTRGKGLFAAVPFREPAELPDAEYPLVMTTGRVLYQYHTGTMSRKCPGLNEIAPTTHVEVSSKDAAKIGIVDQERVYVVTRRGRIVATALVPSRIREGIVFLPFHYCEAPVNQLTNDALDPVAAIPEFKACACRIEKIPAGTEPAAAAPSPHH